jgi:hypothetical protein
MSMTKARTQRSARHARRTVATLTSLAAQARFHPSVVQGFRFTAFKGHVRVTQKNPTLTVPLLHSCVVLSSDCWEYNTKDTRSSMAATPDKKARFLKIVYIFTLICGSQSQVV